MKALKLTLVAVLAALSIAGCSKGSTESGPSSPEASSTPPASSAAPSETASASPEEKTVDLQGQSIKIGVWWEGADPRQAAEKGPYEEEQIALLNAAEKKYNCKIEFVNFGDYAKYVEHFTTTSLAGEPFADVVILELFWAFPQLVNKGLIQPIDEWLDMSNPKYIDWMKTGGNYKGKQYGFVNVTPSSYGFYYNKTLVDQFGLEDPYELQQKGEWTWEKFRDFAKKATKDTNGDGKTDVYGFAATNGLKAITEQFVYTNKGTVDKDANGEMKFSLESENAMEALQFVSDLYNVDKSIMQPYPEDPAKAFIEGKTVMHGGFSWEIGGITEPMKDKTLGYVYFPKGPKADKYTSFTPFGNMFMAAKYSKNAEIAMKIWDEVTLHEQARSNQIKLWETQFPTKESLDTRVQMIDSMAYISYFAIPDGQVLFESIVKDITEGKVAPSTAVEKVKPQFEANIAKLLTDTK